MSLHRFVGMADRNNSAIGPCLLLSELLQQYSCNPLLITLRTLARACFLWVRYDLYLGHIPPHFRPCTLSLTLRVHALGLTVALSTGSNVPITMDNIADPRSPYWSVLASQQYVCG